MKAIRTGLSNSSRSCISISTALAFVLALCFSARVTCAQTSSVPSVVISQATLLAPFPTGGALASPNAAGTSFAVNSNGDILTSNTYGNQVLLINGKTGVVTVLGSYSNVGPVTLDSQNNLYVGGLYTNNIVKVPYVNGTYAAVSAPSSATSPAVCTGSDTTECNFGSNLTSAANGSYFGVVSIAFDSQGDFFYALTNANTAPNAIFECSAACLSTGTPGTVLLYQEPTGSPATTGQLNIGAMAVDASGNLFFTDSSLSTAAANESTVSNLKELVYTVGTGYAATPTVLETLTPASPGQYDDELDGVAVGPNNTVYFTAQYDGVFALPNTGGAINTSKVYGVSSQGAKTMALDATGDVFVVSNVSGDDTLLEITPGNVTATATAVGTPSTATNVVTMLNAISCGSTPTITYTAAVGGTPTTAYSAAATTCSSQTFGSGSYFPTSVTFNPTVVGVLTAALTATDSNSDAGTATITGNATGMVATPTFSPAAGTYTSAPTVTISDATLGASIFYTTDGSTPTINSTMYSTPITVSANETVSALAVGTGDTNSTVATAAYVINLAGATATPTFSVAAGTYATPQQIMLSDTTAGAVIYYTTDGSTPTASSTLYTNPFIVSSTETVNAIAIASGLGNSAVGSALYTINLPPSAFQNVVMSQSTSLGALPSSGGAQSGGEPAGDTMAVNSNGDLIATNTYGSNTVLFSPQGGTPTVLGTTSNPNGVAVDSQNNLYMGFSYNSSVVKIPYVNGTYAAIGAAVSNGPPYPAGTPNCTGNDTVECIMSNVSLSGGSGVVSLLFDSKGDLFFGTTNQNQGGNNQNSIYECVTTCLYTGSPAPTLVFAEPTAGAPNTTGQLSIGGMAIDAAGNLFFTDSAIGSTNNQESFVSNLNELPYTSGTGYAATPTVIYSYTPSTAANYDAEIDGVATSPNGTVYALVQNADGILAFPNTGGSYSNKNMYLVSTQSGKLLTSDGFGNLYEADNGGNIYEITVNNLTVPTSPIQNPITATNITTFLNDGGCTSTPPTVTFAATGADASAFSAATTGTCTAATAGTLTGASFATTLTFTPTTVGTNSATLTATDSLNNSGSATVSGTGTPAPPAATPTFSVAAGTYTTVQTVTISDTTTGAAIYYTTDGSTPTASSTLYSSPITVGITETITAIATAASYATSPVASVLYTVNLPTAAIPTFSVAAGTYTTVQTVTISDATTSAAIYYTTDGSTPTASSTLYSGPITVGVTEAITAIAVATNYNNSAIVTVAYFINLPPPAFTIASSSDTVLVQGGNGSVTLTVTANAAFNGSVSFACSGFLPIGASCAFAPTSINLVALANGTTKLTVTVPAANAALSQDSSSMVLAATTLAGFLCFVGLRKRRRLQVLLLFVAGVVGLSTFSGCTTTSSSSATSSQMVVTVTGSSCPVTDLTCATNPQTGEPTPTQVTGNIPLVLTIQ